LAALSIVLLAACGGGASTAEASSPDDTANVDADAVPAEMQEFLDCMKEHGVELSDGARFQRGAGSGEAPPASFQPNDGSPPVSIDRGKVDAAREACGDLLPEGAVFGGPGGPAGRDGADASAFNAYRSCMSDHGVTIPEPDQAPVSIDRSTDSFKAAHEVCAPLLPNGGQGFVTEGTNP
jgi:hypothetical protein